MLKLNRDPEPPTTPGGRRLDLAPLADIPQLAGLDDDGLRLVATSRDYPVYEDFAGRVCTSIDDAWAIRADVQLEADERNRQRLERASRRSAQDIARERAAAERREAMRRRAELQRELDAMPADSAEAEAWEAWQQRADEMAEALFAKPEPAPEPLPFPSPMDALRAKGVL